MTKPLTCVAADHPMSDSLAAQITTTQTSINPYSLLATDFLNQFNEVAMILEMALDWPEGLEELKQWRPRTYVEHFEKSGFSDASIVIAAYHAAPRIPKTRFESLVYELDQSITQGLQALSQAIQQSGGAANLSPPLADAAYALGVEIRHGVRCLSAIINIGPSGIEQKDIDDVMGDPKAPSPLALNDSFSSIDADQAAIDALFD